MKASDWAAQSQKKLQKRMQAQATQQTNSPNFRAAIADRNYPYGALKLISDTDRISPMYNPYGRSIGRWCVFGADGWTLEQSNNLH